MSSDTHCRVLTWQFAQIVVVAAATIQRCIRNTILTMHLASKKCSSFCFRTGQDCVAHFHQRLIIIQALSSLLPLPPPLTFIVAASRAQIFFFGNVSVESTQRDGGYCRGRLMRRYGGCNLRLDDWGWKDRTARRMWASRSVRRGRQRHPGGWV